MLLGSGAAVLAAQYVPSTVTLGQWGPLRALPWQMCRWRGPASRSVALTFDDGPHPDTTPVVLDVLDRLGVRATFFLLGSEVVRHPDVAAEVMRRGHQVETHGFAHEHHLLRSPRWAVEDLRSAVSALRDLGIEPRWYRPAYGQATGTTLVAARMLGLRPVLWSAWGREWATSDVHVVAQRITDGLGPGAIVLLHDSDRYGVPGMWRIGLEAARWVIDDLERFGLDAVTLDELVAPDHRRPARREV